ncbi:alpha/beta hydrolase [Ketogulonicigenium vulgare]|uniref:alpha/beta hydrolase n=1 Tax=Ketogulonicigenium vulgare TaxID=92945 RepID=UPI002359F989|nr:alpha/beta hydrolase [Ketogulonicigenium vulgare]
MKTAPKGKLQLLPETVFDGAHLHATHFAGAAGPNGQQLMVVFDYRKEGRAGFSAATHSSSYARQGYGQLSIRTAQNDWYLNGDTAALEAALPAIAARYTRVHLLGYSMGGFGALRFARALGAKRAVVISPQFSLDSGVAPFEGRYPPLAVTDDLGRHGTADLQGMILFDPFVPEDRAHAALIGRAFPGLSRVLLPFGGHPAIRTLRATRAQWWVQRAAALGWDDAPSIRGAHRDARRLSQGYWLRLAAQAARLGHRALGDVARAQAAALLPVAGDAEGGEST